MLARVHRLLYTLLVACAACSSSSSSSGPDADAVDDVADAGAEPDLTGDPDALGDADTSDAPIEEPATEGLGQLGEQSEVPVEVVTEGGAPSTVTMDVPRAPSIPADPIFQSLRFLIQYADVYGLEDPARQLYLERVRREVDATGAPTGDVHVFFAQRHEDIPVFDSSVAVHLSGDHIVLTNGRYLPVIPQLPSPSIGLAEAVDACQAGAGGDALLLVGQPRLVYFNLALVRGEPPLPSETRLAWRLDLSGYSLDGVGTSWQCIVDAHTGLLLMALDDHVGHAAAPEIAVRSANNGQSFRCWDAPGEAVELWFDANGEVDYPGVEGDAYEDGQHAAEFASIVHDFYYTTHHRHGWDDSDGPIDIIVHAQSDNDTDSPWRNAAYFDRCRQIRFGEGHATLDLMAHEWAHAIDASEADLLFAFQSGALDESFADVAGVRLDEDFVIGDDLLGGDGEPLRNLAAPSVAHMDDYIPVEGRPHASNDNGGVHTFSGIPNRVAYFLFEGGSAGDFEITPLGAEKAGALYYAVQVYGITPNATFRDARDLMVAFANLWANPVLDEAEPRFGFTASDVCQVKNAWASVGIAVEDADADCDGTPDGTRPDADADWTPDDRDSCPDVVDYDQADLDEDGLGDACDDDLDGDGVENSADPCPEHFGDTEDACTDSDGDGWMDALDNCDEVSNPGQEATDGDDEGDACDDDDDDDSAADDEDVCPLAFDDEQDDQDGDGVGQICDNCPEDANPDQRDCDFDRIGAACDASEVDFGGGACSPPWFEATTVTVTAGSTFEISGCDECPPWLPPEFEITLTASVPNELPVVVLDDRGREVAQGAAAASQTLRFRPRAGFHGQIGEDRFQAIRYFAVMPGTSLDEYDVELTLEHNGRPPAE